MSKQPHKIRAIDSDRLYWSMKAGCAQGDVDPDVSEAMRFDPGICQSAWDAVKAKELIVAVPDRAHEFRVCVRGLLVEYRESKKRKKVERLYQKKKETSATKSKWTPDFTGDPED